MKIICPYVFDEEIVEHKKHFWKYDVYYEKDVAGIGSDLMYQKMWNKFPKDDIFTYLLTSLVAQTATPFPVS